jgi:ABC-type sugar transport system ATPase subunit
VLVSHNMQDVKAVSDRVEVLRLGTRVARFNTSEASIEELVGAMTGALADAPVPGDARDSGPAAPDGATGADA